MGNPAWHTTRMPKRRREAEAFQGLLQYMLATDLLVYLEHMDCRYDEADHQGLGRVTQKKR